MSRWDDTSFDNDRHDLTSDNEEVRLLKKFEGYKELEKIELEKRNDPLIMTTKKVRFIPRFFHSLAVIQGIIIIGFTTSLMLIEFISADIKLSILSLVTVILTGEIVIISLNLRKKSKMNAQNSLTRLESRTEFERI
jgi:hypothetical protein